VKGGDVKPDFRQKTDLKSGWTGERTGLR